VLIDEYFDSAHFNNRLSPRTKSDYKKLVARFRAKFATVPIVFWKDPRFRKKLCKSRDGIVVTSLRPADCMWSFMSAVFSLAVEEVNRRLIPAHAAVGSRPGRDCASLLQKVRPNQLRRAETGHLEPRSLVQPSMLPRKCHPDV
jgi:hypothetical protein